MDYSLSNMPRCESCGAPLVKRQADLDRPPRGIRCGACVRDDGTPKSRQEVTAMMTTYLRDSLDLSVRAAERAAEERIATLPAWKDTRRPPETN